MLMSLRHQRCPPGYKECVGPEYWHPLTAAHNWSGRTGSNCCYSVSTISNCTGSTYLKFGKLYAARSYLRYQSLIATFVAWPISEVSASLFLTSPWPRDCPGSRIRKALL